MGRMTVRRLAAAAAALAVLAVMSTCSNPVDLVSAVEVQVMLANKRYLEVAGIQPLQNATNVDPGLDIRLNLDRDLDTGSVSTTTVKIVNQLAPTVELPWIMTYEQDTKVLRIRPDPYLADNQDFTVRVEGIRGLDGSDMLAPVTWSFRTGVAPKGSFSVASTNVNSLSGYTNVTSITATVSTYLNADYWYATTSLAEASNPASIVSWQSLATPFSLTLAASQGPQFVYAVFADVANSKYGAAVDRTIKYDTVAPTVTAFTINSGAGGTSSSTVTLSSSASDTTSQVSYMQFMNYGGAWSTLEAFWTSKTWSLTAVTGTRQVSVRVRDAAGNLSSAVSDAIVYGAPTVNSASLNSTARGTVTVAWTSATADTGTNNYYVYRRDYPSGSRYTYLGTTTGSSLNVAVPEGSLYYFHVAINNAATGTGGYSTTAPTGYTSNIAIIYPASDATYATALKATLTNSDGWITTYSIGGAMPSWSVTLIPESLVSSTYAAADTWYGYPVIITPNSTLYLTAGKVRNVTAHPGGIVGMGDGGARLLDVIETNYTAWGFSAYSTYAPADIGWLESASGASTTLAYTWSSSYWSSPLTTALIPTIHPSAVQLAYTATTNVGVYRSDDTIPTGNLYSRDYSGLHYFPVARQDRYMQFGYNGLLDRPYTGKVFTVNMIYRMSLFN